MVPPRLLQDISTRETAERFNDRSQGKAAVSEDCHVRFAGHADPLNFTMPVSRAGSCLPRKNLTATRPVKLWTPAVAADTQDQMHTQNGM